MPLLNQIKHNKVKMLQLVAINMLCFQMKNIIRDAQIPQPLGKSMNSIRLDVKMYTLYTQETSA